MRYRSANGLNQDPNTATGSEMPHRITRRIPHRTDKKQRIYPKERMQEILWSFSGGQYVFREDFIREVTKYNAESGGWIPDEMVLASLRLTVQYFYWDDEEDDEIEEDFDLTADNDAGFTARELLFKIHNQVIENLGNEDHHFFEGLTLWEETRDDTDAPRYLLNQGS